MVLLKVYSQVSNKRACSFINFQHFAPSARFFPPCSFINFQKNFHPARLFHPCSIIPSCLLLPSCTARLFLFYKIKIFTPCSFSFCLFIYDLHLIVLTYILNFQKIYPARLSIFRKFPPCSFIPSLLDY